MQAVKKPLPHPTHESQAFWAGCKNRQLLIQRCTSCGDVRFPPSPVCPSCMSLDSEWVPASGKGEVWSFVTFHQAFHPAFERNIPYVVAVIELEEGVRMMSNIVGPPEAVKIGMPVEVIFEDASPEITLPKFKPAAPEAAAPSE